MYKENLSIWEFFAAVLWELNLKVMQGLTELALILEQKK